MKTMLDSRTRTAKPLVCTLMAAVAGMAIAAGLSSCATIQRDVLYDAPAAADAQASAAELKTIELDLVRSRAVPGSVDLAADRRRLTELLAVPSGDATRQARILALSAEAALQAGERMTATKRLDESRAAYGGDEIASVVASRLAKTPDERLAILQKAIAVADEAYRIKAELGSVLLAAGKPREALAVFDASLPFLDEAYTTLYGEQRQKAWALRDSGATMDSGISAYLTRDPIPLVGMAAVAQAESNALDRITGGASWAPGVLFERLRAAGWYVNTGALPGAAATRKDAALFLWMLMTHGDRQMAVRYTERYAAKATSPVPDVPYGSPYFDSVLGVVEEGIMTLVDGRNFDPDTPAAGLDFYGWLLAAAAWR
ncbi:MAG TPA: hypothetical protein VMX33_11745 [bacterium]|nr:hypothetical protein [bacterium]